MVDVFEALQIGKSNEPVLDAVPKSFEKTMKEVHEYVFKGIAVGRKYELFMCDKVHANREFIQAQEKKKHRLRRI